MVGREYDEHQKIGSLTGSQISEDEDASLRFKPVSFADKGKGFTVEEAREDSYGSASSSFEGEDFVYKSRGLLVDELRTFEDVHEGWE